MPRPTLESLAAALAELQARIKAADELALHTAKRLDKHITSSAVVHRELRSMVKSLRLLFESLARPQGPTS